MSSVDSFVKLRLDSHDDGVRVLTLSDPRKRNAIGPEMQAELMEVARRLADDDRARVLIVCGEGTAFCAGADLIDLFDVGDVSPSTMRARELDYYASFLWVRDLPYPTIAAVQGPAIGAGLNLALVCDIVIPGPHARFGATFARLGLHPGGGCTYLLTQSLGPRRALSALLLGKTLSAEDAYAHGLTEAPVEDAHQHAFTMASRIAALQPSLAADIKRAVRLAFEDSFDATLSFESWAQTATAFEPEVIKGIRAAGRSTRS